MLSVPEVGEANKFFVEKIINFFSNENLQNQKSTTALKNSQHLRVNAK